MTAPDSTSKIRDAGHGLAGAPGSANCLPPADVIAGRYPYTTTHQVWINKQLICGTDMEYLADIVMRALNHWRLADEGKEWWSERQKADNPTNADIRHGESKP